MAAAPPLRFWSAAITVDDVHVSFDAPTPSDSFRSGSEPPADGDAAARSCFVRPTVAVVDASVVGQSVSQIAAAVAAAETGMTGRALDRALHNARFRPSSVAFPLAVTRGAAEAAPAGGAALAVVVAVSEGSDESSAKPLLMAGAAPITALLTANAEDTAPEHTFVFSNTAGSGTTTIALGRSQPSLASGAVPHAAAAVTLRVLPMDAAAACGTRGVRTAEKAHGPMLAYGAMPLGDLYRHLCYFAAAQADADAAAGEKKSADNAAARVLWPSSLRGGSERKKRVNAAVAALFDSGAGVHATTLRSLRIAPGRQQPRWALLKSLDLSSAIVGDGNFGPVLGVAAHCRFLESFAADRNGLSLASAPAIVHTFGQHPTIRRVSLRSNDFFESAGDELLRTIRVNRRIVVFDVSGNAISEVLLRRYDAQLERNREEVASNIFNPEGAIYASVAGSASPDDLPSGAWELSLAMWRLLVAAPSAPANGDDNAPPRPPTAGAGNNGGDGAAADALADDMVPQCVSAPLFVAVATRAFRAVASQLQDPVMRQLVAPVVELESAAAAGASSGADAHTLVDAQRVAANLAEAQALEDLSGRVDGAGSTRSNADTDDSALVPEPPHQPRTAPADVIAVGEYHYPLSFAKIYVVALGTMASFPHRWPYAARALKCLGRAHEQLGVPRALYAVYNEAVFKALMHELGPDTMHARMQGAWLHASSFILRALLAGRSDSIDAPGAGVVA
uniref:Uncharacterized protein n=1 Tax=Neobodo designis TaxID=312471 RepID=A0A7S1MLZ1_NEODS|mmetsp:Transcript_4185/g.13333  ORF Transcript_4185/g.13333 Transcript_4185/m.13333 type:complete len:735 (+) Transcript_4185:50-2254(+)|eukprot:CAMPEP_0174834292 /NCGR_PEP_ID=MMETSP1114-20130205/4746_1 /TAXON_ID=312471 /ORGANISM="Neobodo designis, Strain CCAP 1951/1" /LENGTH=734 /DNA_ID=CAMNT_0016068199 /DNA_START=49 /DNA_END=2256 /DNA_ORIENTATION=-